MMKTARAREQKQGEYMVLWDVFAASTRKSIECFFGIVKGRFRRTIKWTRNATRR